MVDDKKIDPHVAAALRQITPATFNPDADPSALGAMLESFVHGEVLKSLPYQENDFRLYHWRSTRIKKRLILWPKAQHVWSV